MNCQNPNHNLIQHIGAECSHQTIRKLSLYYCAIEGNSCENTLHRKILSNRIQIMWWLVEWPYKYFYKEKRKKIIQELCRRNKKWNRFENISKTQTRQKWLRTPMQYKAFHSILTFFSFFGIDSTQKIVPPFLFQQRCQTDSQYTFRTNESRIERSEISKKITQKKKTYSCFGERNKGITKRKQTVPNHFRFFFPY